MPKISNSVDDTINLLNDRIKDIEYNITKCNFVKSHFPDVKVSLVKDINNEEILKFSSKTVNSEYSKYEFNRRIYNLNIRVYTELEFSHNNKDELIRINSSPETCKLARHTYDYKNRQNMIKFSRFSFNMKKNNFREDIFNDCRAQIMQFIQTYPESKLDTKHLEPRLKKLLLFT